jgi:hypothetical protein
MLIIEEFSDEQGPFIEVDESTSYESVILRDPEVYGEECLVDFSSIFLRVLG